MTSLHRIVKVLEGQSEPFAAVARVVAGALIHRRRRPCMADRHRVDGARHADELTPWKSPSRLRSFGRSVRVKLTPATSWATKPPKSSSTDWLTFAAPQLSAISSLVSPANSMTEPNISSSIWVTTVTSYFCANHASNPVTENGDIDWPRISRVKILRIGGGPCLTT